MGLDSQAAAPAMKAIEGLKKARGPVIQAVNSGQDTYGTVKSKEAWAGEPRSQG